jgi:predicted nucleic acid-binding protein
MYLLDTNILSAMMRPAVDPVVAAWLRGKPAEILATATICQAEILAGLAMMPDGRRRDALTDAARAMFQEDFLDRLIPFDSGAATAYARIFEATRRQGRTIATTDLMIAAIADSFGASVVTRNVADFRPCGIPTIDPWAV